MRDITTAFDNLKDAYISGTDGVPFVKHHSFDELDFINYGFSTRVGGVSSGIYESMNLGFYVGDEKKNVIENYKRLGKSVGFDYTRISCPNQVHKSNILTVKESDAGDGITRELSHYEIDAQITNIKNLPLIVYTADCVPILFVDPVKKVIATAHAGWRGTIQLIAEKVVYKMADEYNSNLSDIKVLIGPSAGPDLYEVDETVISEVNKICNLKHIEINDNLYKNVLDKDGKYLLNLWNLNKYILMNSGISNSNISICGICTLENNDLFFSHRMTNGKRGLGAGVITLI